MAFSTIFNEMSYIHFGLTVNTLYIVNTVSFVISHFFSTMAQRQTFLFFTYSKIFYKKKKTNRLILRIVLAKYLNYLTNKQISKTQDTLKKVT